MRQALAELGLGPREQALIGLRLYKVRMPWPLEPEGIRTFSQGLDEVLIVEERREIIENQIKQQLFNWRADVRPRIVGKFDETGKPFLSLSAGLTVARVAGAIAERLLRLESARVISRPSCAPASRLCIGAEARGEPHVPPGRAPAALLRRLPAQHLDPGAGRIEGHGRDRLPLTWCSGWTAAPKPSPIWAPRACPGRRSAASPMRSTVSSISAMAPISIRGIWRSASRSRRGSTSPTRFCSTMPSR